jgi:hypothetical protein
VPIKEKDPWRDQYFEGAVCPDDLIIPTDDSDSWLLYPEERWIYNKLLICETQGLPHAPHGIAPERYPVFSKPVYNLRGMGTGGQIFRSAADYEAGQQPGHFWMPLFEGEHVSTDYAVIRGEPVWWRHVVGHSLPGGVFDYWRVLAEPRPALEAYCGEWLRRNLPGYTGMVNLETLGGGIIEGHLRFADQWPDLYGPGWVRHVVTLYTERRWDFHEPPREGYSVVLFAAHGHRPRPVRPEVVAAVRASPDVSSVQITFHADRPPDWHAMPPGGFRLAIVNAWTLEAGRRGRRLLADMFGVRGLAEA